MTQTHAIEDYVHTLSAATAELADALDHEKERTLEFRPALGTVQRRIVALAGMAGPDGMRVAEIARQANRPGGPSTHIVLDTLHRRGIVESLPGERYRLAPQYRRPAALAAVQSTPRHRASMRT
jgi:hypothetical protein